MTEILSPTDRPQLRRRRLERERFGRHLREAQPVAPLRGDRGLRRVHRRRRGSRGRRSTRGVPGLGGSPRSRARGLLLQGGGRDRGARRADRAGHDGRDGQAAARGTDGVGARRRDPPLLGGRGVPARGRGVRAVRRQPDALHAAAAARRRRPDHAVELPGRDPGLEARAGPDLRQHRRPQARLRGAAHRPPHRRVLRGGGLPAGRAQRDHRRGLDGRRRARLEPRRPRALLHGLGRRRPRRAQRGDRSQLPRAARARRSQSVHRDGRRRARSRRRGGVRRRVLVGRAEVHRDAQDPRAGHRLRRVPGEAARAHRRGQGRRPGRSRHRGRAASSRPGRSRRSWPRSSAARRRAARSPPEAAAPTTRAT